MRIKSDYKPILVDLIDVPRREGRNLPIWKPRFDALPEGKAVMLRYNNHQRAHQVRTTIAQSAKYWKFKIRSRIIHAEPAIHGTDGWLLYYWKEK